MNHMQQADRSTTWARVASLVRPTVLTPSLIANTAAPDPLRPWCPEQLLPLYGTSEWAALTASQRSAYSRAYACQLLAEFIWIERHLILAPLSRLHKMCGIDAPGADDALRSFAQDERQHIAGFSSLLDAARSADPLAASAADAFLPPIIVRAGAALAGSSPVTCSFWTHIIQAFETYAVDIGQRYNSDPDTDPAFRTAFVAHARDEARHCRFDELLAEVLRDAKPAVWQTVNRALAERLRAAYLNVGWGLDGAIDATIARHPELGAKRTALLQAAQTQRRANAETALPLSIGE